MTVEARAVARVRFASATPADGTTIRYAERGVAGDMPVVFLHGYADSWNSFRPVFERLRGGRHALAPDQRGHGDSGKPAGAYGLETFVADAVGLLDALAIRRATFVGHSLGSFIAQALALAHPERVEKLVLIGSGASVKTNGALREFQSALSILSAAPGPAAIREFQTSTVHAPLPQQFLDSIIAESAKVPLHVWREALAGLLAADLTDRLAEIRQPAWIVWGDRDAIFPRPEQDALLDRLSRSALSVYRNAGHAPHWERPGQFARELERFLDGDVPGSAVTHVA